LSAKEFIGSKAQMTRDQTTFADAVASLGLQRGIEGSKARHTRIQAFYEALEHPVMGHVTISPESTQARTLKAEGTMEKLGLVKRQESPEMVAERLTRGVRNAYEPAVTAAAGAREMAQKARQAQETACTLRDRLKPVLEALRPLGEASRTKAIEIFQSVCEKALAQQREQQRQKQTERQQNRGKDRGR
jgi:DNA-directed RNA polymerase subunit K/omega